MTNGSEEPRVASVMKYEVTEVAFRAGSDWEMNFFGYVHTPLLTFLVPTHIKYHSPTPSHTALVHGGPVTLPHNLATYKENT